MSGAPTVHASCVVVGEAGVLIRGASGAGKSRMALDLIERASAHGLFARLVADDRVFLAGAHGRVIARPPAALAGLIELRGVGLLRVPWLSAASIRLVADITDAPARLPDDAGARETIAGVTIARVEVRPGDFAAVLSALLIGRPPYWGYGCGADALAFALQHGKASGPAQCAPPSRSDRAGAKRGGPVQERNESCAVTT